MKHGRYGSYSPGNRGWERSSHIIAGIVQRWWPRIGPGFCACELRSAPAKGWTKPSTNCWMFLHVFTHDVYTIGFQRVDFANIVWDASGAAGGITGRLPLWGGNDFSMGKPHASKRCRWWFHSFSFNKSGKRKLFYLMRLCNYMYICIYIYMYINDICIIICLYGRILKKTMFNKQLNYSSEWTYGQFAM